MAVADFEELGEAGPREGAGQDRALQRGLQRLRLRPGLPVDGASRAAALGAVAALVRSATPLAMQTPHTGAMNYDAEQPKIPAAAVSPEDAMMLARLSADGVPVKVHLEMGAHMEPDADSGDVIGEIPGREHPEEVVVMGGHIDSWDVGQGAQDDGASIMACLQALALIKKLGLQPRRTIRVAFWVNEENGGRGGEAYRAWVGDQIKNQVAAIEMDGGAEAPRGLRRRRGPGLHGNAEADRQTAGPRRRRRNHRRRRRCGYRSADPRRRARPEPSAPGHALFRLAPHRGRHAGQGESRGFPQERGRAGGDGLRPRRHAGQAGAAVSRAAEGDEAPSESSRLLLQMSKGCCSACGLLGAAAHWGRCGLCTLLAQRPFREYPAGNTTISSAQGLPGAWRVDFRPADVSHAPLSSTGSPLIATGCDWREGHTNWTIDYPRSDRHLAAAVRRLTRIQAKSVEQPINLDDGRGRVQLPLAICRGSGPLGIDRCRSRKFREYLLRGGFFMCDDFHGMDEWNVFVDTMQKVFPDRPIVEIAERRRRFPTVFDLDDRYQVPGAQYVQTHSICEKCPTFEWGRNGVTTPTGAASTTTQGRLMVAMCHNMDLGDSWEHADNPQYPAEVLRAGHPHRRELRHVRDDALNRLHFCLAPPIQGEWTAPLTNN